MVRNGYIPRAMNTNIFLLYLSIAIQFLIYAISGARNKIYKYLR